MKKIITRILFPALLLTAILSYTETFSTGISSLQDLSAANVPDDCISNANTDCKSPKTGNIYPDYKKKEATETQSD